jgi:hypothetical protein
MCCCAYNNSVGLTFLRLRNVFQQGLPVGDMQGEDVIGVCDALVAAVVQWLQGMYVYMYVCMYVCMYVYVCVRACVCVCVCVWQRYFMF